MSTVIALLFIDLPWLIHNVFKELFEGRTVFPYIGKLLKSAVYSTIGSIFVHIVCAKITFNGILGLVIRLFIATFLALGVMLIGEFRSEEFRRFKEIIIRLVKR